MDASPPPTPPTTFERLVDDVQRLILSRVPCGVDRGRMSLVCRPWRDVLRRHQAQPPLPWLLLPAAFPEGSTRLACAICDSHVHHYLTIAPAGARCFGSHDGGWLFLHYRDSEPRGNHALNVRTGHVERLPINARSRYGYVFHDGEVVIQAAALSASPDDASYIGAAIMVVLVPIVHLRRRLVAFWRKGCVTADELVPPEAFDDAFGVEDVVYHNGAFHMLTQSNHIRVAEPRIEDQNQPDLSLNWKMRLFQLRDTNNRLVLARYLVQSRGELLLVLRFTPQRNQPTSMFKVFRQADADAETWAWSELDTLGGRILFVGHGCSKSYEVAQHPSSKDGVYFLDDGEFYEEQVMLGDGNLRQYPCSDNGKWSEGHFKRRFPRAHPSDYSAPVWLLP